MQILVEKVQKWIKKKYKKKKQTTQIAFVTGDFTQSPKGPDAAPFSISKFLMIIYETVLCSRKLVAVTSENLWKKSYGKLNVFDSLAN